MVLLCGHYCLFHIVLFINQIYGAFMRSLFSISEKFLNTEPLAIIVLGRIIYFTDRVLFFSLLSVLYFFIICLICGKELFNLVVSPHLHYTLPKTSILHTTCSWSTPDIFLQASANIHLLNYEMNKSTGKGHPYLGKVLKLHKLLSRPAIFTDEQNMYQSFYLFLFFCNVVDFAN